MMDYQKYFRDDDGVLVYDGPRVQKRTAVRQSLAKWRAIYAFNNDGRGQPILEGKYRTCGLCQVNSLTCERCPIAIKTKAFGCRGTAYSTYTGASMLCDMPAAQEAALEMIALLELLERAVADHDKITWDDVQNKLRKSWLT